MSDQQDAVKLAREWLVQNECERVNPTTFGGCVSLLDERSIDVLARAVIAQDEELRALRARLNPTIEEHDANPAQYWAERELDRDECGFRIPRLADCDWPKHHLRVALADVAALRAALKEALEIAEDVEFPDDARIAELRKLVG